MMRFFAFTQAPNSSKEQSKKINKTQINIVYNHYEQEGDNSAVTGGTGTERLTVYGPSLSLKKQWTNNAFSLKFGSDIISSASTDNIDSIVSSASAMDARTYIDASYEHDFKKKNLSIFGGVSGSIESDYFSIGNRLGLVKENKKKLSTYSLELNTYFDDLRWGRLDEGEWRPQKLIYPQELRDREWFDHYKRFSANLKLGYTKVINKRTILGVFPTFSFQQGLLSTPFHRVYFSDGSLSVEQLPDKRFKTTIALRSNHFVKGNIILKNTINPYVDNFGILGVAIENETALKLNAIWTLLPNARFYIQRESKYFAPFESHDPLSNYFTSDYDLSSIRTYNFGLGVKYAPFSKLGKRMHFNLMTLRYNFMYRSNGLYAHILSLSIQLERDKKAVN